MTAKQYLNRIRALRSAARTLETKEKELRAKAEGINAITYDRDAVQAPPKDRLTEAVIKMIEVEERYARAVSDYHTAIQKRMQMIEALENPAHVQVLTLRYCREMRWEKVADEMNYSLRQTYRVHGRALQAFEKRYWAEIQNH